MANKASNLSDLIQRVTGSCLLHPLGSARHYADDITDDDDSDYEERSRMEKYYNEDEDEDKKLSPALAVVEERGDGYKTERQMEMVTLMNEVFETVSSMKKAYVSLQESHCPWDPQKNEIV